MKEETGKHTVAFQRRLDNLKLGPQSLRGRKRPDDVRKAISIGNKDKPKSSQHCKALSLAHMGNILTEETKKKMSKSHSGLKYKSMSKEGRKNISKAGKGRIITAETRKKLSDAGKRNKRRGTFVIHHMDLCHGKKDPLSLVKMLFEDHSKMHAALRVITLRNRWLMQFDILNSIANTRKKIGGFCPIYV